ncbi:MAG: response regulator, partial [Clostridia bacterium]|nr:response regulator [Clostridia bacterium]
MADIIIVEDNEEIGKLLCDLLRKENLSVTLAQTGEKALELFERYGAKVFILDIMLPGVDGLAVCSKIRETSNAYIVIASAKSGKEDKLIGLELGADDYI